jgi:hypothetical protein
MHVIFFELKNIFSHYLHIIEHVHNLIIEWIVEVINKVQFFYEDQ